MSSSGKLKIPLHEISSATNGFAKENIIGEGGYGKVYRGQSKQHGLLAIKRLIIGPLAQGDHEYGMEIELLSKYKHENLVSLIGFCGEGDERILAYKYEANGSLDKVLRRKDISWMLRLHICLGAARGLRYLHNETGTEHGVIHRDIKSSNILLDENWNAKISDFGLSKIALTTSANSVIFTVPCGTQGYFDPQILYGGITQKSDVYSFGVVLYEVLFGKFITVPTGYDDRCDGRFTIEMARKHHKDKTLYMLIDPDLINEMNSDSLSAFSAIAYQCLEIRTEDRPTMSSVVESLEKALGYQQVSISRERFRISSDKSEYLYDVYISFRIPETEFVVDWLCDALKKEGLSTYKDTIRTPRDVPFEPLNIPAIKQSRSFAIIFSKNFGLDFWILDEVKEIINCVRERGNVVIPVFWDVDPSDVSEQKGYFGKNMICREEWKNALAKLSNLPGLDQSDFKRFSNNPAKEVAAKIKRQLSEGRTKDL